MRIKIYTQGVHSWEHIESVESPCYAYTVFWVSAEFRLYWSDAWKNKTFASKREAINFAKSMRTSSNVPKPYIVRKVVSRNVFKEDVKVEKARTKV